MEKKSTRFLLWSIIISGVLIIVALGIAYQMLKNTLPNQVVPAQNSTIRKFNNNVYGY